MQTHEPVKNLKQFHDKYHPDKEQRLVGHWNHELLRKRRGLIREEAKETVEQIEYIQHILAYPDEYEPAVLVRAKEDLAKELADLLYVVYGTAEELAIPIEWVFKAVHKSNMDKLWPDGQIHYNQEGKVIKPPNYSPPDLSFINEYRV